MDTNLSKIFSRIYLVRNAERVRPNDHVVVQEYIDKVLNLQNILNY